MVRVKVNENCYIRYPREGGESHGGNFVIESKPDGKKHRVWKGDEFDCEKSFADNINKDAYNIPASAEARPILTIIGIHEATLPIIKASKPAVSEIAVVETETISIKSKPGPKPKKAS